MSDIFISENELYKNQPILSPKSINTDDEVVRIYDQFGNTKTILNIVSGDPESSKPVSVQNPLPTDGDSVYCKDIWPEESIATNWIDADGAGGELACIPFNNLHTALRNTSADNPKILRIHFNRTIFATQVGLGCAGHLGEGFKNVRIVALGSGGVERIVKDESTDGTLLTSRNYIFSKQELFNAIQIEFHTSDPICVSNITIQKVTEVSVGQTERTTNSLKTIDYSHAEIHSGSHYTYRGYHAIGKNGVKDHLIVTPDTDRWAHMTVGVGVITSEAIIQWFEAPIVDAPGDIGNTRNRNRNYTDNNTTLVYEDPTIQSGNEGDLLQESYIGSGKNLPGSEARDSEEILLERNTAYLIRVTEQDLAATIANFAFDWYEHTNKDEPEP